MAFKQYWRQWNSLEIQILSQTQAGRINICSAGVVLYTVSLAALEAGTQEPQALSERRSQEKCA